MTFIRYLQAHDATSRSGSAALGRRVRTLIGFLAVLLFAAPCTANTLDKAYGPDSSQRLDVLTPEHPNRAPAVLLIHGGGWQSGSRQGMRAYAQSFVAKGIVAIPIDYRLADGSPATRWPAQLEDVQLAVRWVRAHARELDVDPEHICAMGGSAGAELSLLLGILPAIERGDMADRMAGISPRVNCVIAVSAPTDFETWGPHPVIDQKLFGQPTREQRVAASPVLRLGSEAPPMMIVHGAADRAVPFAQAQELRDALARHHASVSFVRHAGAHDLPGMSQKDRTSVLSLAADFVLHPEAAAKSVDLDAP